MQQRWKALCHCWGGLLCCLPLMWKQQWGRWRLQHRERRQGRLGSTKRRHAVAQAQVPPQQEQRALKHHLAGQ